MFLKIHENHVWKQGLIKEKQAGRFQNRMQPTYINHIHDTNSLWKNPIRYHSPVGKSICHSCIWIKVYTVAMDGGDSLGTSETPGERNIPNNLLNLWARGSFLTNEACLEYHFMIHSGELGISNIVSYVNSAQSFRSNLRGASSSHVSGKLKNVTRWKKNGKYVDISGSKNTGLLVSYGRS